MTFTIQDAIVSKLEYTKKKKYRENNELYSDKIELINKVINNEQISKVELTSFLSQLEYSFKKKLMEHFEQIWDYILDKDVEKYNKTETAMFRITKYLKLLWK